MSQVRPGTAVRGVHTSWRALSAGEAVLAVLLDVLVVALPAAAVGVGLGSGVLAWMVALEVVVLLVLVEARSGRTPGLLAVSAASSAPHRGSAPGLGRAVARAALRPLLPLRRGASEAAGSGARQSVLDLLTGTVTVTSRPAPAAAGKGRAGRPAPSGLSTSAGSPAAYAAAGPAGPSVSLAPSVPPADGFLPSARTTVVPGPAAPPPAPHASPPPPGAVPPGAIVSSSVSSGLLAPDAAGVARLGGTREAGPPTPDAARPEPAAQRPVQPPAQGRRAPRHRAVTPPEAP